MSKNEPGFLHRRLENKIKKAVESFPCVVFRKNLSSPRLVFIKNNFQPQTHIVQ